MPPWTPDHYRAAYRYAAEAHRGQFVPETELPYILHVGLVAMEVIAALRHEDAHDGALAVQCALLHDVLEDTPIAAEQLAAQFGPEARYGVQALSKDPRLPKDEQMRDSLLRIQRQPSAVWMVKLADRITNLQPPPPSWGAEKCRRYRDEARLIHEMLGSASPTLAARLLAHIESYARYCA